MNSVSCSEYRELLGPYIDDGAGEDDRRAVEAHMGSCPPCRLHHDELLSLRTALRAAGPHPMPSHLVPAIEAALDAEAARRPDRAVQPRWTARRVMALAASHVLVAALAAAVAMQAGWNMRGRDEMLREAVSAQVRATVTDQVVQVASSDRHTVKPWLAGKLTFSPVVPDFKNEGFPLLGARIEMLGNRPVAALIYGRRGHRIAVFVAPASQLPQMSAMQGSDLGYSAIGWKDGAFDRLAVSDLNSDELQTFVALAKRSSEE